MAWQYPLWTFQTAQNLGFTVWDLYYDQWGVVNTTPANEVIFPNAAEVATLGSCYGIVIGPRSTVDRVFIDQTIPTQITTGIGLVPLWWDRQRIIDVYSCNVLSPLLEPVTGPLFVNPAMELVAPAAPTPTTQYYQDGGGLIDLPFGSNLELPALHLQFLLKNRDVGMIPTIREPMYRKATIFDASSSPLISDVFLVGYPVASRSKATLQIRATSGTVSVKVTGLSAPIDGSNVMIETTLGEVTGVTGSARIRTQLNFEYMFIYYTATAGNANAIIDTLIEDRCCGNDTETYPAP